MPRPPQTISPLTITWENRAENLRPRGILNYSIDSNYLVSTDEFEIVVYDSDPSRLRWLQLEPVQLSIYGEVVLVGRIERVERGREGSSVTLRGRDYFADIVQGEIDPTVKITEDQVFDDVIKYCGGPYGINSVVDFTGKGVKALKPGERKPDPGQGVYDFLNRIGARLGCTLQPTTNRGEIAIDAPDYTQTPATSLFRSTDPVVSRSNNIIEADSSEDYTRMPTHGVSSGKVAKTGESPTTVATSYNLQDVLGGISTELLNSLSGKVDGNRRLPKDGPPSSIALYRLLYVKDDDARSSEQIERAIVRAVSERLKDTLEYRCTLNDHRVPKTTSLWTPDTVVNVTDDPCDIEEPLWVSARRFNYAQGRGATTQLSMYRLGAFQV